MRSPGKQLQGWGRTGRGVEYANSKRTAEFLTIFLKFLLFGTAENMIPLSLDIYLNGIFNKEYIKS